MVEVGARFANNLYAKLSMDPDNEDAAVTVEIKTDEGVVQTITGEVVWDVGGDDDGLG